MTTSDPEPDGPTDLLDANLLIALVVTDHVHHDSATRWRQRSAGAFATCPTTQGALVRFLVRNGAAGPDAQRVLGAVIGNDRHRDVADDINFMNVDLAKVVGHRQVADAYLAGLARRHGYRLATLDRGLAATHPDVADLVPS